MLRTGFWNIYSYGSFHLLLMNCNIFKCLNTEVGKLTTFYPASPSYEGNNSCTSFLTLGPVSPQPTVREEGEEILKKNYFVVIKLMCIEVFN